MDLAYLSKTSGIGGQMKLDAEDFVVEEITKDGTVLERDAKVEREQGSGVFTHFVLQKKNWNTIDALKAVGDKVGASLKSFGYAGTKDRSAITTQLASVYKKDVGAVKIKDIRILGKWSANDKVSLGDLLGNRFTIKVKTGKRKTSEKISGIYDELGGVFPNYFGPQRFGNRRNTHLVGKNIIQGSCRRACEEYLFGGEKEENEKARIAREDLKKSGDYKKALAEFPQHLTYERLMLLHLSKNPNDFANAIRKIPRGISLMFVHAYQSYLFNKILSAKLKGGLGTDVGEYHCLNNEFGFPDLSRKSDVGFLVGKIIGYESELGSSEKEILEQEEIRLVDFKLASFPELGSKGGYRLMTCPIKDFLFNEETCEFKFSLPSGAYATMVMREFLDEKQS